MALLVRLVGGVALLAVLYVLRGPVNAVFRVVVDVVLLPFRGMHPLVGLTVIAVPASIGALLLFRATSDQEGIVRAKDRIYAGLFEIRLFNDDLRAIFRAQGEILAQNARYFAHALVPLLWMIGPFVFLIGQLQFHYGYEGLRPGQPTIVKVTLAEGWRENGAVPDNPGRPAVSLEAPAGVRVETAGVWVPSLGEIAWRVAAEEPGEYEVVVKLGERTFSKTVSATDRRVRRAPLRVAPGPDEVIHAGEAPLPKGTPVKSISVGYAEAAPMVFDLSAWVWAFFGLTLVFGFALKGRLGVTV